MGPGCIVHISCDNDPDTYLLKVKSFSANGIYYSSIQTHFTDFTLSPLNISTTVGEINKREGFLSWAIIDSMEKIDSFSKAGEFTEVDDEDNYYEDEYESDI